MRFVQQPRQNAECASQAPENQVEGELLRRVRSRRGEAKAVSLNPLGVGGEVAAMKSEERQASAMATRATRASGAFRVHGVSAYCLLQAEP